MSRWRGGAGGARGDWRQQRAAEAAAARAAAVPGLDDSRLLVIQAQLAPLFTTLGSQLTAPLAGEL